MTTTEAEIQLKQAKGLRRLAENHKDSAKVLRRMADRLEVEALSVLSAAWPAEHRTEQRA